MASSNLKTMRSPLPTSFGKGHLLPIKTPVTVTTKLKTATVPLQVKCEKRHKPLTKEGLAVSRREMMQCLTAGVFSLTLVPEPAEARMSRQEMKKKIMEKLEELREKAGLSKPKTEKNGMKKSPTEPSPKDNNKSPTFPLPLPPPEGTAAPLVEATVKNTAPPKNAS
ncbi:hypothetical protein HRI_002434900 [Hibiscus trionum]|uniref:Uncharacterized protein n=1 Tax=Hibiscus trionum TaxID=183268 RepID=A0A9W7I323_HIBTR|nr:hypothetical protein HRI_002434900 [Hibiscus trionum]